MLQYYISPTDRVDLVSLLWVVPYIRFRMVSQNELHTQVKDSWKQLEVIQ